MKNDEKWWKIMKKNEKLWRTTKQVMYESDAVNLSFSLDLQQIIDVVNIHFFSCILSSKWWRSALKWFKSQIWEVWWWDVGIVFVAGYLLFDKCIKQISNSVHFEPFVTWNKRKLIRNLWFTYISSRIYRVSKKELPFVKKVMLKLRSCQNLAYLVKYVLTSKNKTFIRIYQILSIVSIPIMA